jgi:hypothetical protein
LPRWSVLPPGKPDFATTITRAAPSIAFNATGLHPSHAAILLRRPDLRGGEILQP